MSSTSLEEPPSAPSASGPRGLRGLRWWLKVAEVRLRFIAVVLAALVVVSQWERLRSAWDRLGSAVPGTTAAAVSADTEFFCPMDPGVLSAWPAVCPICNMDLVQRRKHDAQLLPEGVVARMQLSPYRVQLAGIKTAEVVARPLEYEIRLGGRLESGGDDGAVWFEAPLSSDDASLFQEPKDATVEVRDDPATATATATATAQFVEGDPPRVRVTLPAPPPAFAAGRSVDAVVRIPADGVLPVVPEPAVVDHGNGRIVFVESMPGQFDAVPVRLGRRVGDSYAVLEGVEPGQRVAAAGAFLIDAETRLNPSLAVTYFGASGSASTGRVPRVRVAEATKDSPALSAEDLARAKRQKVCPVTDLPLDSMGGPIHVTVEGRKVFLCCAGCEDALKSDPAKYLAKLPADD